MRIIKMKDIRGYQTELKAQFSTDKKYTPIAKAMSGILRSINPFLSEITDLEKQDDTLLQARINHLHEIRREATILEDVNLLETIRVNNEALKDLEEAHRKKAKDLSHVLNSRLETLDDRMVDAKAIRSESDAKALMTYHREIAQAEKKIADIKESYQRAVSLIENQKANAISEIEQTENQALKSIDDQVKESVKGHTRVQKTISKDSQAQSEHNDQVYLSIKTSYHQLSVDINKKISELKASRDKQQSVITEEEAQQIVPIREAIDQLQKAYQQAKTNAESQFVQKNQTKDALFERQKESYESKKRKIIHDAGESITLLNSKLSSYRESINRDKLMTSREMRQVMKTIDSVEEKDRMNRQLTKKLNALDNDLNRQIIRTQKDILAKQRDQQRRLFMHDQYHIRQMNDWRLSKTLFAYEKKQELTKIDLNYQHNMTLFEQDIKKVNVDRQYKMECLSMTYLKDMLPLETQLQMAAVIQERELNLLANDAHLDINLSRHKDDEQVLLIQKDEVSASFEKEAIIAFRKTQEQVTNITTQLSIEEEKLKRDTRVTEQQQRTNLAKALYEKALLSHGYDYDQDLQLIENDRTFFMHEHDEALERLSYVLRLEKNARQCATDRAKIQSAYQLSSSRSKTILETHRVELDMRQAKSERLFAILRMFQKTKTNIKHVIRDLYLLPSHPEVFKMVVTIIIRMLTEFEILAEGLIDEYQSSDQAFYAAKIDSLKSSRYVRKREDLSDMFDQEIAKIDSQKQAIVDEVMKLDAEMMRIQSDIDKAKMSLETLQRASKPPITEGTSSSMSSDAKDDARLVSTHEADIKQLTQTLQRLNKTADDRHRELLPFNDAFEKVALKKQKAMNRLEIDLQKETSSYLVFQNKADMIHMDIKKQLKENIEQSVHGYQRLINEVYVTDTVLADVFSDIDRSDLVYDRDLVLNQQTFLDLMKDFHTHSNNAEDNMIRTLARSTSRLLEGLDGTCRVRNKAITSEMNRMTTSFEDRQASLKNVLAKQLVLLELNFQKRLSEIERHLKTLESTIQSTEPRLKEETKLLSDNSNAIVSQVNLEHDQLAQTKTEQKMRQLGKIDQLWIEKVKALETLEETLLTRNQLILSRADQQTLRLKTLMRQKQEQHRVLEEKAKQVRLQKLNGFEGDVLRTATRREESLRNLAKHHRRYVAQTTKQQQRIQRREINILRKSHRFKMRMLHLN